MFPFLIALAVACVAFWKLTVKVLGGFATRTMAATGGDAIVGAA